ncbi:MAG TPA: hypothetical protein PKG51_11260 [Arachnia sp.]|nr:hypothetical protein [Arachnia sp.]
MSLRDRLRRIDAAVPKPPRPTPPADRLVLDPEAAAAVLDFHELAGTLLPLAGDALALADVTPAPEELLP